MMWWTGVAMAGLGPVDTMVLFNADSPDATDVAAAYAEARHLPDGHQCGVTGIDPTTRSIDFATFDTVVRTTFDGCLAALPDPSRINVLVTVRGLPYLVELDTGSVGFEAALQVMHAQRPDESEVAGGDNDTAASVPNPVYIGGAPCQEADLTVTNPFSGWYRSTCNLTAEDRLPRSFARARPLDVSRFDFTDNLLVVGRLDGFDFDDARALIVRSVDSDDSMPAGELLCMQSADQARGARDPECEYLVRRLQDVGANAVWLDTFEAELAGRELAALFTGAASFREGIAGNTWLPGAIACNLTSFGAVPNNFFCDKAGETCPERESQTSIARFVRAGATGAHGTVAEPLNNTFPDASTILLYQDGYTMGEAFLFSSEFLYWYNLVLGDPLAAPYAHRPEIVVAEPPTDLAPLVLTASHPDGIASLELFVDGVSVARVEEADTLSWQPDASEFEFLAVATAAIAEVERTDWDVSAQRVRAQPQGWLADSATVMPEPTEMPGECGCGTSSPMGAWFLVPAGLLLVHRRRRIR